ncbi:MAG: hypothetical protein GEV05_09785 [Betaproteobacteria bacterium]|nr:hypothetical protein [Betaproteobacteria bacterium]
MRSQDNGRGRRRALYAAIGAWLGCMIMASAEAMQIGDVQTEPFAKVDGIELVLNGAGLRKRYGVNVYVIGLYLRAPQRSSELALALDGPKRIALTMMRGISAQSLVDALYEGLRDNSSEPEYERLKSSADALAAVMLPLQEARKGDLLALDYIPGCGAQVSVNGRKIGSPVPGPELYRALLKIWLGHNPADANLKRQLLGVSGGAP